MPARQPHDDDDERDLHGHRNHADERADRTVNGVAEDELP